MKKTKKIVALLLVLSMVFGMFGNVSNVFAAETTPDWFATATEITSLTDVQTQVAAGEKTHLKYVATGDGFFDFVKATSAANSKAYVTVYKADGTEIADTQFAYVNTFLVEAGNTYYFEVYSEYFDYELLETVKPADTITWTAVFYAPQTITSLTNVQSVVAENYSALYKYVPTADGILDFCNATSTKYEASDTKRGTKLSVRLCDEKGKTILDSSFANAGSYYVTAGKTYYLEITSYYNTSTKQADTITWNATCEAPQEITTLENNISSEIQIAGGAKYYKYVVSENGFFDLRAAVSATTTENAVITPNVKLYKLENGELSYPLGYGTFDELQTRYSKKDTVYIIEIYALDSNGARVADTVTWDAKLLQPTALTTLTDVKSELTANASVLYKFTATVDGYFEFTAATSSETKGFPKFYVYTEDGQQVDGGTYDSIDKIAVKTGDIIYIDVYDYNGLANTVTWSAKEYECGTVGSPEVIEDAVNDGRGFYTRLTLEPNHYGKYYEYTTTGVGQLLIYMQSYETNDYEIKVTLGETTKTFSQDAVKHTITENTPVGSYSYEVDALIYEVAADEKFTIQVYQNGEAANNVGLLVMFTPPLGHADNQHTLTGEPVVVTIPAGERYYFRFSYGQVATFLGSGEYVVSGFDAYEEVYTEEVEAEDNKAVLDAVYYGCYVRNTSDVDIKVKASAETPLGSSYSDAHILGEYNNINATFMLQYGQMSPYYIVYVAEKDTTLYLDMPEVAADATDGWYAQFNIYGETETGAVFHSWDNNEAYALELKAGDYVEGMIIPATNDPEAGVYPGRTTACTLNFVISTLKENVFTDVIEGEDIYYYEPVLWAYASGVTQGTDDAGTKFSPDDSCTRGQIVTFLWRAMGCPEPETDLEDSPFKDVDPNEYYAKAILWAYENEITDGTNDEGTQFSPEAVCTRGQVVTFLHRLFDEPDHVLEGSFSDVDVDEYYGDPIAWALEEGITDGTTPTTFSPEATCTRGQIVTFLYRAFN